jgi:glycosyltransferase involved in cell wall biosynthesis
MKIIQLTTDNRQHHRRFDVEQPYFGTAPEALLQGFASIKDTEVHVIACSSRKMNAPEKLADNIWFHQPIVPKLGWGKSLYLGCAYKVRKLIRSIKPDIVHGQGTERDCSMEAILSGYSNVMTIHGNMRIHAAREEQKGVHFYKVAAALETFCLKRTDGVVAISNYTRDLVSPLCEKTWLLPNAADLRYFDIILDPPAIPRILFVGSLGKRKNPSGLLEACKPFLEANLCTLDFAGEGGDDEYSRDFQSKLASTQGASLLGFIDRDALAVELSKTTILALPTFEDNCPMVVLEAMAAGVPVIAANVGGVPDLIEHGVDGLLFSHDISGELNRMIGALLTNSSLRGELGKAGKETAIKRFHPKVIASSHMDIYNEVISSRSK